MSARRVISIGVIAILLVVESRIADAQGAQSTTQPAQADEQPVFKVMVVETAPLPGVEMPLEKIPAPVQSATAKDIEQSNALDLSAFMNRRLSGVHVNEVQNNPYQADVNYRGYTASPLLGTPQGLSVYMDGVRLNQPFGDVVSWDLIPQNVIAATTLMPGSNPLFGLNTLGGALSIQTKDGLHVQGTTVEARYGGDLRRSLEIEHGGRSNGPWHWFLAGTLFAEDGWRDDSPSEVRQFFSKIGWLRDNHAVSGMVAFADNDLTGNGLQVQQFVENDYSSIYTKPDETDNRSTLLNVTTSHRLNVHWSFTGNAYYRDIRTDTLNGDINEDSLDQEVYQPNAAEQAALTAAGYTGFPTSGANASNTPFPYWRCIGNVLLNDEPAEKCNGLINRSETHQNAAGFSGQATRRDTFTGRANQVTAGAAYDRSRVDFAQSTQLAYLNPDRSLTGVDAFADGETGGEVDGEPFDTRVDLDSLMHTWSAYATDTFSINSRWNLTASGRYDETRITNRDRIDPGGGQGSLDGHHVFRRLNPAFGVTFSPRSALNIYAGYTEGSRAPTSIELGCADPEQPCKLPNAMTGDPPLDQVVTRTVEGGARGQWNRINWSAGAFTAGNDNDILFVMSDQTGFGYFRNFGETRRQGLELEATGHVGRVTIGASYTYLRATYESEEEVNGEGNSTNDEAEEGAPGLDGLIEIEPGDRIPLVPAHLFKTFADVVITPALGLTIDLIAVSSSFARGNENNQHEPDDVYYTGPGEAPGYAVVNLSARYQVRQWLQIVGQINNLFDREYYTAAQLGSMGFTDEGNYIARPFPPLGGEFPVRQSTFFAPGAPIRMSAAARFTF